MEEEYKCKKCWKDYPKTGRWYKKGRKIEEGDKIIESPIRLCGECYEKLNDLEKNEWIFELENFGIKRDF